MWEILPIGLWAASGAAILGVCASYLRGHPLSWRIVPELVGAVLSAGSVAELLLPLDSFFICAATGFFTGLASGVILDVWAALAPAFVRNVFNQISVKTTGESLPETTDLPLPQQMNFKHLGNDDK